MEEFLKKDFNILVMFGYYEDLLTEKQKKILDCYYNEDLSLSEIALNEGISRQGVYNTIKNSVKRLSTIEERVGLIRKLNDIDLVLKSIEDKALKIRSLGIGETEKIKVFTDDIINIIKNFKQEE